MSKTEIYDLSSYPLNNRTGSYGGKAGDKEGITINEEDWIVKYPKSTKGMEGDLASYSTAPLSEYIGSHIYQILGFETHDTILGVRNGKLVVACKDFCEIEGSLREIRTIKNVYNEKLSELLEKSFSSTSSSHLVDIDELLLVMQYNPILQKLSGIEKRFWDLFIIDILINNNDRNNGNWGVLYENNQYRIAPVYDNGASFSNKLSEEKIQALINDDIKIKNSVLNTTTIYSKDGKKINARDIINLQYGGLDAALIQIVPQIKSRINDIRSFISDIPETYFDEITSKNIAVCSSCRKIFYLKSIELRLENFLLPALEKAQERTKNMKKTKRESIPKPESFPSANGNKASVLNAIKEIQTQQREVATNNKNREAKHLNKGQSR